MKTFTKIFLTAALVLAITGALFLGIGLLIGGTTVLKDGTKITLDNPSIKKAVSAYEEGFDLLDFFYDFEVETNKNGKSELSVLPDKIQKIDVDTSCARLYFKSSDSIDKVTFSCEAKKDKYRVTFELTEKGVVKVRPVKRFTHYKGSQTPTITITCPKNYTLPKMDVDIASGNITFKGNQNVTHCRIDLAAGNIKSTGLTYDSLNIDNAAGNVSLTFPDSRNNYDLDLECSVGNITVDGDKNSGFGKEFEEHNEADRKIDVDCATGNINLNFNKTEL